jgi:ribokinase
MNPDHKPISVIGSIVYDLVMELEHLPATGETVPGTSFSTFIGGKGLNQAVQIHRLGYPVIFRGRIGDDSYGQAVIDELERQRFPYDGINRVPGEHTAVGMIFVGPDGRNLIGGYRAANMNFGTDEVDDEMEREIRNSSILSVQLEIPDDVIEKALRIAVDAGVKTILNAAPWRALPDSFEELVDYWVVNEVEAGQFFDCGITNANDCFPITLHQPVIDRRQVWVVTLGDRGAAVVDSDGVHPVDGIVVDAVDSTGAGDSFTGGFAVGIAEGMNPVDAAIFANRVASISVTKLGGMTGLPLRSELEEPARDSR